VLQIVTVEHVLLVARVGIGEIECDSDHLARPDQDGVLPARIGRESAIGTAQRRHLTTVDSPGMAPGSTVPFSYAEKLIP
jgi:hypothetical protein